MPSRGISRRRLLTGPALGAALLIAGCGTRSAPPRTGRQTAGAATTSPLGSTGDEVLVAAARTELRASLALVSAVLRAHPQLADPLRTLVRHRTADLAIVDPDARLQPPRRRVPHRLPEAVRLVARDAARQESLRRHQAQEASSGDLARVLASMSASEAQHVVLLAGVKGAHR